MSGLLGIESATTSVSAAIWEDGVIVASFACAGARRQTEVLHPAIALLLQSTGRAAADLDGVVVDVGPGRFTGVRVAMAAAKALAFGAGVPITGCLSTAILLEDARTDDAVAVVDLRRGEVAALFAGEDPLAETIRMTPSALGQLLAARGRTAALLVGDGAVEYEAEIASGAGCAVRVCGIEHAAPTASGACRLAGRGEGTFQAVDPAMLEAVYLRGADVRLGWATRDLAASPTRMEVG